MLERKNVFSDLDTCPDNFREIPVAPVLHPKYQPYGSVKIASMLSQKVEFEAGLDIRIFF